MRPSRLRHRITIQHYTISQHEETNEEIKTWSNLYERVAAGIEPLSTRDFIAAQGEQSEISVRMLIRYKPDIVSGMRIIHKNCIYTLEGDPLTDKKSGLEYLTLLCSRGAKNE